MGMRQKGIAVVAALSLVAVVALLSLVMVQSALASLRTGGDLLAKAQARQLAEAGLDQGIAFLASFTSEYIPNFADLLDILRQDQVSFSGSLSTGGYQVALRCSDRDPAFPRWFCEVRSTGESGRATHQAKALVEMVLRDHYYSFVMQGWFTGGEVTINGNLRLMASRLHADGGYVLSGPGLELCDATGGNCTRDPQVLRNAVTAGLDYRTCSASGLCPPQTVCPIWGDPPANDDRPCYNLLLNRMATVSTHPRILISTDVTSNNSATGSPWLREDPYARLAPPSCDRTITSPSDLASISSGTVCLNSSLDLSSPLVVPAGVKLVVGGDVTVNSGASVEVRGELYVQGDYVNGGSLSLEGGQVVVGGNVTSTPQLTVSGGNLIVGGNLNLRSGTGTPTFQDARLAVRYSGTFNVSLQAEDSVLLFGSSLTFNGSNAPNLVGDTFLATNDSMTFNGSLRSNLKGSPLLVSNGDVTFNGSYQNTESASHIWARGTVRIERNTEYRGWILSGGGVHISDLANAIVPNDRLTSSSTNYDNTFLPRMKVTAVKITSRR
jgi:hypothetical protein